MISLSIEKTHFLLITQFLREQRKTALIFITFFSTLVVLLMMTNF